MILFCAAIYVRLSGTGAKIETERWPSAGLMLCQRLRRWHNIKPALGDCPVPAGRVLS